MEFGEKLFDVFESRADKETSVAKETETLPGTSADTEASAISGEQLLEAVRGSKRKSDVLQTPQTTKAEVDTEDSPQIKKGKVEEEDAGLMEMLPRIQIHRVETVEACLHEVAIPPNTEYQPLKDGKQEPAKTYPFVLDPFQKEAILCLENSESVLVSAHTSAGKTVVAEYAIALSLKAKQRVIYTTPIKALSNQKFREFAEEFVDVGLMTGDVTINPTASCLIMTTEILRSMLYRGSEVMREVAWVIFDEIHYMRDKERGVVWEETIILLPDSVHYVFLSATIPNAIQFAEWICFLHKQACHVVYTEYRPVPLQHYIFPAGGEGIFMVVDEKRNFREENFNKAMSTLQDAGGEAKGDYAKKGRKGGTKGDSNCFKIVKMIMERNFAPVIVFSFSRKECEAYALQMTKLDFNSDREKELIEEVFKNAIDSLSDEDKQLPQVSLVLPLLKKGIGIHHSGLLPLLKETIEILFAEGLIKALFATETFAMGLNMPARTVVFTSARKFDGKDFRWVSSGEYIQMSGRAGRRGLDDKGVVILMIDEKMSPSSCKEVIKGQPDCLNSAFHLTYNMVLNLLRVEEINPEYMLERSFYQFQNYAAIPDLVSKLETAQRDYSALTVEDEQQVSAYYKLRCQLDVMSAQLLADYVQNPQYLLPFLQPGRLVKVVNGADDFGWGMVVNFKKKANTKVVSGGTPTFIAEVLLNLSKESAAKADPAFVKPKEPQGRGEMTVVPVTLQLITRISSVRLYFPKDLRPLDNRQAVAVQLEEVQKRFPDGLPLLDPIIDMGIKEKGLKELVRKMEVFEQRLQKHALHNSERLTELYEQYRTKTEMGEKLKTLKQELKKKKSLLQMDELKCMKRVLRRLGYATPADVIEMKGRVACEISSGDELLLTELLFNGVFNELTPQQVGALLSCFVFQEKSNEMPKLTEALSGPLRTMQESARRIARISRDCKLELDEETYVDSFKPHIMDVVNEWADGASFAKICKMTDIFEGSIIRCMRRLEELLRQMCQAAKAIGNAELENKFAESIVKIKRDIVFAASLYL